MKFGQRSPPDSRSPRLVHSREWTLRLSRDDLHTRKGRQDGMRLKGGETFFQGEISPEQERLVCVGGGVVGFVVGGLVLRID